MIREFLSTFADHYNANKWLVDHCSLVIGATTDDSSELPQCILSQETGGSAVSRTDRSTHYEKYVFSFQGTAPDLVQQAGSDIAGADDIIEELSAHFDGQRFPLEPTGKILMDLERSTPPFVQFDEDSDVWLFGIVYEFSVTRTGRTRTD